MTDGIAIDIRNLRYAYPNGTLGLEGINLKVDAGERLAILGANGAGKTTLLLHLNGILQGEGDILVFNTRVEARNLTQIRQQVGLVFQNPDDQLFCASLFEDVAFGPRNLKVPEEEVAKRVEKALEVVGLAGREEVSPLRLSVGEKKRAAIATVLSMNPPLLALDEPSSNLDPRGKRELAALLKEMLQTQIMATHDLEFARKVCTRAVIMHRGKIVAKGQLPDFLQDVSGLEQYGL